MFLSHTKLHPSKKKQGSVFRYNVPTNKRDTSFFEQTMFFYLPIL